MLSQRGQTHSDVVQVTSSSVVDTVVVCTLEASNIAVM